MSVAKGAHQARPPQHHRAPHVATERARQPGANIEQQLSRIERENDWLGDLGTQILALARLNSGQASLCIAK